MGTTGPVPTRLAKAAGRHSHKYIAVLSVVKKIDDPTKYNHPWWQNRSRTVDVRGTMAGLYRRWRLLGELENLGSTFSQCHTSGKGYPSISQTAARESATRLSPIVVFLGISPHFPPDPNTTATVCEKWHFVVSIQMVLSQAGDSGVSLNSTKRYLGPK